MYNIAWVMIMLYNDELFFAKRLAYLRSQKGVSAREMSLAIGQNENYINQIENGKSLPSLSGVYYICEYLEMSVYEFFDESNPAPGRLRELCERMKKLTPKQIDVIIAMVDDMLGRK